MMPEPKPYDDEDLYDKPDKPSYTADDDYVEVDDDRR